jgi:hypothetical protein
MFNTVKEIEKVSIKTDALTTRLDNEHTLTVDALRQLKTELVEALNEQRNEIVYIQKESERLYKENRRKRIAALKRLKSE